MADETNAVRERAVAWLREVKEQTGWSWTRLAKEAGVSTSTLSKQANDPDWPHTPSTRTINLISRATGIRAPDLSDDGGARTALPEREAAAFAFDLASGFNKLVKDFVTGKNTLEPWRLSTRALELAGYLPGDVIVVDLAAKPRAGDIVIADAFDRQRGRTDTIWRVFQAPYLVAAAADPLRFPPRDERDVKIRGVMVAMFRPRRQE